MLAYSIDNKIAPIELKSADKYIHHVNKQAEYWYKCEETNNTYFFIKHEDADYEIDGEMYQRVMTNNHEGEKGLIWFYDYVNSDWYKEKFKDKIAKRNKVKAKKENILAKVEFEQLTLW